MYYLYFTIYFFILIRKYLPGYVCKALVHELERLELTIAMSGTPKATFNVLQWLQNRTARGTHLRYHITPIGLDMHSDA